MIQPSFRCPQCDIEITPKIQRKMSPFWAGPQPTNCEGCSSKIQWHHSLHKKMYIGGNFFKIGFILCLLSIPAFITINTSIGFGTIIIGVAMLVFGFLYSSTPSNQIKIELINET